MVNIVAIGRIGILGVGLGIGAALASMQGIAAGHPVQIGVSLPGEIQPEPCNCN